MVTNTSIPRPLQPIYGEGSSLRSPLDVGSLNSEWKKNRKASAAAFGLAIAVQKHSRDISKLRRRIIGGGATLGGAGLNLRGEYDPTATYVLNDMVVISLGINQGTFVCISVSSVTATAPYTGGQNWIQLPGGLLGQWM